MASTSAWAQCTDNFNFVGVNIPSPGAVSPVSGLVPLGTGSSLGAFISTINTINTAFLTQTNAFVSAPGNPQPDQQGSGVWARGVGGTLETKSTTVGVLDTSAMVPAVAPATGRQTCHTTVRQDYVGYQVGHDIAVLNGGGTGANFHFGVTAGYLEARTKDITPAGSFTNPNFPAGSIAAAPAFNGVLTTPAGTFKNDSEIPFAGVYVAFTKGGFFLDGQARWDFYQNQLTDSANGLAGQELDATGFSLTGNTGYNLPLGGGWFIEPSGGVVWSRVSVNPLSVVGVQQIGGPFFYANGTVNIDDIESTLGRATLRVGTNFTSGGIAWQPFFTASVFHEFSGDVHATAQTGGVLLGPPNPALDGLRLSTSTSRIETYGQFALGTAAAILNTGWLGYARVDYRIGEDIEGWNVSGGLRYQFTPGQAASVKDAPVSPVYSYNWTGPYIGGSVGAVVWGDENWVYAVSRNKVEDLGFAGALVGGQAGYNIQVGNVVYGIEGDYGWTNAHGGASCPNANLFTCEVELDYIGSLTGRVGIASGRALFYAKGGWAFSDVTLQTKFNAANGAIPPSNTRVNGSSETLHGWTVGAGMEFALTNHVSAKAEYMYYDLGSDRYTVDNGLAVDGDTTGSSVRIGLNLHFSPVQREVPFK